jgi:vancomycin resistance protein VanJ
MLRRLLRQAVYTNLAFVVLLTALLHTCADQWWVATLLLFGPRWVVLVPLGLLLPFSLLWDRRLVVWLGITAAIAVVPFMGLAIPWQAAVSQVAFQGDSASSSHPLAIRVLTYNCGFTEFEEVLELVDQVAADVVVLNEWPGALRVPDELTERWDVGRRGNNVILSRFPITRVEGLESEKLKRWEQRAIRCEILTPHTPIQVIGLHLETPRHGLTDFRYRLWKAADSMRKNTEKRHMEAELASQFAGDFSGPSVVAGDFNTPIESQLYREFWSSWQNAFSQAGLGLGHTKLTRYFGVRIDHILVSPHWRVLSARIGPDVGGDHRPVIADMELRPDGS